MGFRGIIRDLLSIYIGYEIIKGYIYKNFDFSLTLLIATLALFILSIWFILERIGILPKIT